MDKPEVIGYTGKGWGQGWVLCPDCAAGMKRELAEIRADQEGLLICDNCNERLDKED